MEKMAHAQNLYKFICGRLKGVNCIGRKRIDTVSFRLPNLYFCTKKNYKKYLNVAVAIADF